MTDGTVEEGDIVIGADGVHSVVKPQMWAYASKWEPDTIPESDKTAVFTDFAGIFGVSDMQDSFGLGPGDTHIIFGHDVTKLMFTQPGSVLWALMYKQDFSQPPKRIKNSREDVEEVVKRHADTAFTEKLKLGDLWKSMTRHGLLNIEEGILGKWHAGRIALVGDSAHKVSLV
jgi:FAD dependent monooxygenase